MDNKNNENSNYMKVSVNEENMNPDGLNFASKLKETLELIGDITYLENRKEATNAIESAKRKAIVKIINEKKQELQKYESILIGLKNATKTNAERDADNALIADNEHLRTINKDLREQLTNLSNKTQEIVNRARSLEEVHAKEYQKSKEILEKELKEKYKYSMTPFLNSLLPAIELFQRQLNLDRSNMDSKVTNWLIGFDYIGMQIRSALNQHGIEEINPSPGSEVDPATCKVVDEVEVPTSLNNIKPGQVVKVAKLGYKYLDKVLEYAQIIISKTENK